MNQLVPITALNNLPALSAASGDRASLRFLEFFAVTIGNPHTRRARKWPYGEGCPTKIRLKMMRKME